jgi:CBS domain containing-hemolysin-like protein
MEQLSRFLAVIFLVALNGFFVAAEFAFVRVQASQLDILVQQGRRRARVARHILSRLDEYLSACQIGITIASLALGWVGEPFIARYLRPLLHLLGVHAEPAIHAIAFAVAFAIISFLHIVLGELAPKSLAIRKPVVIALHCAFPLKLFYLAGFPFIWILNQAAIFFLRIVGIEMSGEIHQAHSEAEIRAFLIQSEKVGELTTAETQMLERVFDFHDREAHHVIVPRPDIVYLSVESDAEENLQVAEKCGFTRFPLSEGSIDHVVGFVHVKDLYSAVRAGNGPVDMLDLKREILFFPEHTPLERILKEFQRKKVHLGIVLDEYGGTLGMLTLEDVIEELVGEIQDEFDREVPPVRRVGRNEYLLDGSCPVSQVEEFTGMVLPETGADTVAGVILDTAGDLPEAGERIPIEGGTLVVELLDERRIKRIRLVRTPRESGAAS